MPQCCEVFYMHYENGTKHCLRIELEMQEKLHFLHQVKDQKERSSASQRPLS